MEQAGAAPQGGLKAVRFMQIALDDLNIKAIQISPIAGRSHQGANL